MRNIGKNNLPRKILYLSPSGTMLGARISLLELCTWLDKTRYEPVVAAPGSGNFLNEIKKLGIPCYSVDMRCWRKGKYFLKHPYSLYTLIRSVRKHKIDLIHCNESWANPFGVITAGLFNLPCVCHVRSPIDRDHVGKYYLDRSELIIAISNEIASVVKTSFSTPPSIQTIYNGVDLERFQPASKTQALLDEFSIPAHVPVVGIVGRVCHRKAQDIFLRAAKEISNNVPGTRFLIVGPSYDNDYMTEILSIVKKLKLESSVIFTGPQEDMVNIYTLLDVLVLPSREEGFGRVNIEAMAMEIPVVATDAEGIKEVVSHDETGYIIPVDDWKKLAESVISLLENKELALKLGKKGRQHVVKKFSIQSHVHQVEKIYDTLLHEK